MQPKYKTVIIKSSINRDDIMSVNTYKAGEIMRLELGRNEDYEQSTVVVIKEFNIELLVYKNSLDCPYDIRAYLLDNGYVTFLQIKVLSLGDHADDVDIHHHN